MIARIEGKLVKLDTDCCLVQVGAVGYEVMLPGYCVSALSGQAGSNITLCTMEYYEGTRGGGNLVPRMVGFLSSSERDFFTKYTAIENADDKTLMSLPGVGRRMSQQIIAELQGKLQAFAAGAEPAAAIGAGFKPFQTEALEILIAWGEKRAEAMELVELACRKHPDIGSAEALVPLVYRLKQGVEV